MDYETMKLRWVLPSTRRGRPAVGIWDRPGRTSTHAWHTV